MDRTYAAITEMSARLAGRLRDDTLASVRRQYAAGEWSMADDTLLLTLAREHIGITRSWPAAGSTARAAAWSGPSWWTGAGRSTA
ncbi:hypothetical protein [Micromonospora auratinigra]|uniref:Uncharacterized protein n=1 Tax=Micromonospora auratinigra TaxID=261654 RepID=A0A1A8ZZM7_9ACTN|nr:hypothetical protein [Micromonospora auratinigra]SBT49346.1 hypothetical protein GA0070611_4380 [Micromonospora auratinigra]